MTDPTKPTPRVLDLAIALTTIAMLLGLVGAVGAMTKLDFSGAGLCLLATGVTGGLLANAVLRD